jgi:hypothetical protein
LPALWLMAAWLTMPVRRFAAETYERMPRLVKVLTGGPVSLGVIAYVLFVLSSIPTVQVARGVVVSHRHDSSIGEGSKPKVGSLVFIETPNGKTPPQEREGGAEEEEEASAEVLDIELSGVAELPTIEVSPALVTALMATPGIQISSAPAPPSDVRIRTLPEGPPPPMLVRVIE